MADLTAKLTIALLGSFTDPLDLVTVKDILDKIYEFSLADGTGTGNADIQWHDQRSVSASSNDDIDLTAVTTAHGTGLGAKLKMLFVKNTHATQSLTLFDAASNAFQGPMEASAGFTLAAGEVFCFFSPAGHTIDSTTRPFGLPMVLAAPGLTTLLFGVQAHERHSRETPS